MASISNYQFVPGRLVRGILVSVLTIVLLPLVLSAQETDPKTIVGTIPVTDSTDIETIETVDEEKVQLAITGFDPNAKIREIALEVINGYLVYKVDVKIPVDWDVLFFEIIVDAGTGELLGWWMDDEAGESE